MRKHLLLLTFLAVSGFTALFAIAGALAEPRLQDVEGPPDDLPLTVLRIPRSDGGEIGRGLAPLLVWQVEPRLGISPDELAPITAIRRLDAPVMIIAGTEDRRTRLDESKALYLRAKSPKRLWLTNGARHEDFHRHSPADYERRVLDFFARHLATPAT